MKTVVGHLIGLTIMIKNMTNLDFFLGFMTKLTASFLLTDFYTLWFIDFFRVSQRKHGKVLKIIFYEEKTVCLQFSVICLLFYFLSCFVHILQTFHKEIGFHGFILVKYCLHWIVHCSVLFTVVKQTSLFIYRGLCQHRGFRLFAVICLELTVFLGLREEPKYMGFKTPGGD